MYEWKELKEKQSLQCDAKEEKKQEELARGEGEELRGEEEDGFEPGGKEFADDDAGVMKEFGEESVEVVVDEGGGGNCCCCCC